MIKKVYTEPLMEVIEEIAGQQLLAGSITDVDGGDTGIGFGDPDLPGGAQSPLFDSQEFRLLFGN